MHISDSVLLTSNHAVITGMESMYTCACVNSVVVFLCVFRWFMHVCMRVYGT